jgi:hypothetical protein
MSAGDEFRIERATERDVPLILKFIKELADYERLTHEVIATEASLRESLFGSQPGAEVVIAYAEQNRSVSRSSSKITRLLQGGLAFTSKTFLCRRSGAVGD